MAILRKTTNPAGSAHHADMYIAPSPGVSPDDYIAKNVPMGAMNEAYYLENEVSVFSDIVQTLINEILRNGVTFKPLFVLQCKVCGHKSDDIIDSCPVCGSGDLRHPDESELKKFYHADGSDYFERANNFNQSLVKVLEAVEYHMDVANRGIIQIRKAYAVDEEGTIVDAIPLEICVLDPRYVTPIFNARTGKLGGKGRVCIRHAERSLLGENQMACPVCGHETYDVLYETNMPSAPTCYYIKDEIRFVTKYGQDIFGYPAILKIRDDAYAYHHLEKRTRRYYERGRTPGILSIPTNNLEKIKEVWKSTMAKLKNDPYDYPWVSCDPNGRSGIQFVKLMEDPSPNMLAIKDDIRRRMGSFFGVSSLWQNDTESSGGLNNESQQLTVSNRAFARGQRIFNEDILPWISRQFGINDWVLELIPAEDADELRDEQLMSARLDNVQKALQVGLKVDWKESDYSISGTPKLQEQSFDPVSVPEIPSTSGEVSKAELTKACPPGEHEHSDFPYCHPTEREHRSEGGRENESETPSENQAGGAESAQTALDDAETVDELGEALQTELKALIPDLQTDLALGDLKTCKTSMKQFASLTKQYNTACRELKIKPLKNSRSYAGTFTDGSAILLNTNFFSSNPGSTRPGSMRAEEDIRKGALAGHNPPIREGEEIESIITHEFGHTLVSPEFYESIKDIWQEYSEKFPDGVIDQEDPAFVSGYAATDEYEFVSECFVSVMHTDNPSTTARSIVEKIDQFFRREYQ